MNRTKSILVFLFGLVLLVSLLVYFFVNNKPTNSSPRKHMILSVEFKSVDYYPVQWACECANWTTYQYGDDIESLTEHSVFMEPAFWWCVLPDSALFSSKYFRFQGQFYLQKGFPKGYESQQDPPEAKVFRYFNFEMIPDTSQRDTLE